MSRALVVTVVLALAAAAGATPSPSAPAPDRPTIGAQPSDLLRDRRLTLFGSIPDARAKQPVVLEARDCGQSLYRQVARVETTAGGRWSWSYFYPGITADIRASWNGRTSAPARVRDRAFVELRSRGGGFYVSVRAKLPFEGRRVLVQRLDAARGWVTVASPPLTDSGAPPGAGYVYSWARVTGINLPPRSLVRAFLPAAQARPCYLAGRSNVLRVA